MRRLVSPRQRLVSRTQQSSAPDETYQCSGLCVYHLEHGCIKCGHVLADEVTMTSIDAVFPIRIGMVKGVWIEPVGWEQRVSRTRIVKHFPKLIGRLDVARKATGHPNNGERRRRRRGIVFLASHDAVGEECNMGGSVILISFQLDRIRKTGDIL